MRLQMRRAWEQMVEQIRARILWRLFPLENKKHLSNHPFPHQAHYSSSELVLFVCLLQKIRVHRCVNAQQRLCGPLAGRL